jgi:hypothetical protein
MPDGSSSAFLFSKLAKIVNVQFYPPERVGACVKFVELIKAKIYAPGTQTVLPQYEVPPGTWLEFARHDLQQREAI